MPKDNTKSPSETDDVTKILGEEQPEESKETEAEASKGSGEGETQTETKLKIGEEEMSPEEAAKLISKARQIESIEKEQNVDIAKLYPDYTKKSQLLKDPVQLGAYIAKEFGEDRVPTPETQLMGQAVKEAKEKYGIVFKDDLESFKQSFREELEVDQLMADVNDIEKENGIDHKELLDFMKVTKNTDPYDAAEKYAKYQKISSGVEQVPAKPTFTEKSGSSGTHVPQEKKLPSIDDTTAMRTVIAEMMEQPSLEES